MDNNIRLISGNVLLVPYQISHLNDLYEAVIESMAELMPWLAFAHPGYSIEETRVWLAERPEKWVKGISYDFAIVNGADGSYIGGCGLNDFDSERKVANLGYWVRSTKTKQGNASIAASLLIEWGIRELSLKRIEICVAYPNIASQHVALKVGAIREAVLRNRMIIRDLMYDEVMFSVIPSDINH
jgi:RimJ/RimL family protein N-acetyltransferase